MPFAVASWVALAGLGATLAGATLEQEALAVAKLVVEIEPAPRVEPWAAVAFERNVVRELMGFGRVTVVDRRDIVRDCPKRSRRCLLAAYRAAQVDLVVFGVAASDRIDLDVFETWTPRRLSRGSVSTTGNSLARMRQQVLRILSPVFVSSGWLDKRPYLLTAQAPPPLTMPSRTGIQVFAAALFSFFGLPLLLLWVWSRLAGTTVCRPGSWPLSLSVAAASLFVLLSTLVVGEAGGLGNRVGSVLDIRGLYRFASVLGGLAWGTLALLLVRLALPRLVGIERGNYQSLGALVVAWLTTVALRLVPLALIYGPTALGLASVAASLEIPAKTTWLVVAPLIGLAVYVWGLIVVDTISVVLDALLVEGEAASHNGWNRHAGKYFRGYVKRLGLAIPRSLLERVLILPSAGSKLATYGGGWAVPRIVVPREILELALGDLPQVEDDASPRRYLDVRDHLAGIMLPQDESVSHSPPPRHAAKLKPETRSDATIGTRVSRKRRRWRGDVRQERLLGENATLLGLVAPFTSEESIPLIANDSEDFGVVKELLSAHYARFVRRDWDEEYDDTDPSQLDLLFGALQREVGGVLRNDHLVRTVFLLLEQVLEHMPQALRQVYASVSRVICRAPERIGDAYPALNQGRDALIQFLYYRLTNDTEGLTARADSYRFEKISREIVRRTADDDKSDLTAEQVALRARLLRMNDYLRVSYEVDGGRKLRIGATLGVFGLTLAGLVYSVLEAVDYAPTYSERIAELRAKLEAKEQSDDRTD